MIGKYLKNQGYNLRERFNIYSGALIGAATPIVALRYLMFPAEATSKIFGGEVTAWTLSLLGSCVIPPHFILAGFGAGAFCGIMSAKRLMRERNEKESKLEQ